MRIAVVETATHGGLLHYAVQLAEGLAGRGHDVELIGSRGNELERRPGRARMRAILAPPTRDSVKPRSRVRYFARRAAIAARLTRAWLRVLATTRRGRFDAVLLTGDTQLALSAAGAGLLTLGPRRPPVAAVCHNVRVFNRWGGDDLHVASGPGAALLRWLYPRLDAVFVHGERSLEEFRAIWPPSRLYVIPHGDESLFGDEAPPPASEPRALFFGDWRKVKGLTVLMEAFDALAERHPQMRLTIAGTPAAADLDPELVRRWAAGHAERVTVIDHYVPIEDVPALFGSARVVVNPYLTGYQSGVVHLAMTMGRAVVASDVGDLGAAVRDGETGVLVPAGDAAALASALERVLLDADLAARLGQAGRSSVLSGSSWATVAELVEQALVGLSRRGRR
jgi:glycosyltransferase involved in cell wall biosynthesis